MKAADMHKGSRSSTCGDLPDSADQSSFSPSMPLVESANAHKSDYSLQLFY